ncbi:trafficking kinesin-binding protein 1-like isoform X2 [Clavelina lepadiformis]|uniref:trafficking kinesin-binding protein 1-like isoform X2 n=1 Tax=Clavelina lepadiformis TaxID=159417 RepID=UPI004042F909
MLQEAYSIEDNSPEEDIASFVFDEIPRYQLRANKNIECSQSSWIETPVLSPSVNTDLSPEQCEETFKFFLLSGKRLSQMTRTYHDIEAVVQLLEEKEKDLELAARIGQTLLTKNKEVAFQNDLLEEKLTHALEEASQLRHEVSRKEDLLHIYADDETDSSGATSPSKDLKVYGRLQTHVDGLHHKIQLLEKDKASLLEERSLLFDNSGDRETKEHEMVSDTVRQLGFLQSDLQKANSQILAVTEELTRRNDEADRQQDEISGLLAHIMDLQHKHKELANEHEDLQLHLSAANKSQYELSQEVQSLEERYCKVLNSLDETREESRLMRDSTSDNIFDYDNMFGPQIPFQHSLAAELEISDITFDINEGVRKSPEDLKSCFSNKYSDVRPHKLEERVLQTARYANKHLTNFANNAVQSENPSPAVNVSVSKVARNTSTHSSGLLSPSMGKPGIPGTSDLQQALEKLATVGREGLKVLQKAKSNVMSQMCGSRLDADESSTSETSFEIRLPSSLRKKCMSAPKLRIVKSLEGSTTLHQWKKLADKRKQFQNVDDVADDMPGIIIRCNAAELLKPRHATDIENLHPTRTDSKQYDIFSRDSRSLYFPLNEDSIPVSSLPQSGSSGTFITSDCFSHKPYYNDTSSTVKVPFCNSSSFKSKCLYSRRSFEDSPLGYSGVQSYQTRAGSPAASSQKVLFSHLSTLHHAPQSIALSKPSLRSVKSSPHLQSLAIAPSKECFDGHTSSTTEAPCHSRKTSVDFAHLHGRNNRFSKQ